MYTIVDGHDLAINTVHWRPRSDYELITSSFDQRVRVWDIRGGGLAKGAQRTGSGAEELPQQQQPLFTMMPSGGGARKGNLTTPAYVLDGAGIVTFVDRGAVNAISLYCARTGKPIRGVASTLQLPSTAAGSIAVHPTDPLTIAFGSSPHVDLCKLKL